ncbi:M2 family metallopeptidase [Paludibaculum fermentans]|uniref:M2 family metallopeptidase n=1 Tax=Paludibaculum fermentans TaxID=1473598 RepID=A0A7S7NX74_PALFE|nr:M2 family metallopeptidase [Paludibaculum fermentans]QOY91440.1 M2 family metallopeptidase [Paludibaculum fermentans]
MDRRIALVPIALLLAACGNQPTAEDAKKFVDDAEAKLFAATNEAGQAQWVQQNFITQDTEALNAKASERVTALQVQYAKDAAKYDAVKVDDVLRRKLLLLKLSLTLPAPADPKEAAETAKLAASLDATYGKGKYCPGGDQSKCMTIDDITKIMATSRDPKQLLEAWTGWHSISPPMKKDFVRLVELANKGSKEIGFADTGALWRSQYDMPPDEFAKELDRLWEQVKPLYLQLHAYTRWKLREKYGKDAVPENGPIPAHLLGNIWAQQWNNVYPLLAPKDADVGYDLNAILKAKKTDAKQMVKYGEGFFTSLGFAPLPPTFWERSLFVRPRDRDVVCHASAWDVDNDNDLRVKMCIDITEEDFDVIHHELGHNFYQRAYNKQPFLFRNSANDGFHEAIGDTIALSLTPDYLIKLGLINKAPDASKDIGLLLQKALDKVAFLPFGLLIDQWRWKVYSGQVPPDKYNQVWWELRQKYQGVAPASVRGEEFFDPGAKYHVPGNVPYTRYFLAHILQFQFHKALSETAGCKDPVNRCSIYGNKEAGKRLADGLELGISKPWPDALEKLTGTRQMDGNAVRAYFAPLEKWLIEQNKGKPVGW